MKNTLAKFIIAATVTAGLSSNTLAVDEIRKQDRVLIVLSELDSRGAPELEGLYRALEDLTGHFIGAILQDKYEKIITLKDSRATLANFKTVVYREANDTSVKAIDVIMSVHGAPTALALSEDVYSKDAFRDEMLRVSTPRERVNKIFVKKKLRVLYNLACYGGRRMDIMRDIGFAAVNGARGVNANSEVELVPALTAWANGVSFKDSFIASNNPVALLLSDGALRQIGRTANNMLKDVDSEKLFSGEFSKTINSVATE